ncbi:hypothetical protein GH741_04815 [Aquibacillus halophilus]|uniref:YtkA-like domain-containing protein n=1 Tax=Aquibacillus halophilus TaxID=930132 RepID=A0A6A8DBU1_9BACI|nr:FixH family protein [Aquibacillus halophilus]MRH41996.1 hypothetical protein [Aquibacillus halophilus]
MKQVIYSVVLVFILIGCGQNNNDSSDGQNDIVPVAISVDLQAPETVEIHEVVTIEAVVTQGEEAVDDADEVVFEIWKEAAKESSETLESKHEGDGVYSLEKTFDEEGVYFVQSHVTAREMHTMPQAEIVVGNPEETEEAQVDDADTSEEEHHHHHGGEVTIEFDPASSSPFTTGEEVKLTLKVFNAEEPLSDADVTLEIKQAEETDAIWIDLKEEEAGNYSGLTSLEQAGNYTVTVHVKKGDIHEHQDFPITVE